MEAQTLDIILTKGGDWNETINLYEDDAETLRDTTGYDMVMTIKHKDETFATLTVGDGITHTPGLGQFNLNIPYTDIEAYKFLTAERRVILIAPDSARTVLIIGTVTVR